MKLLVSDFDGTLYTDDYKKNIEAVNKFVDAGNLFAISTGRDLNRLLKDLDRDLKFNYLICSDGAVIYDSNFNEIYRSDIEPKVVDEVCEVLRVNDCFGDIDLIQGASMTNQKVSAIYAPYDEAKIEMAHYALSCLQKRCPQIHGYLSTRYINITNRMINKATAIHELLDIEKLNPILVHTIGDDQNDREMLLDFIGCAMVNNNLDFSTPVVKNVAELVRILL